MASRSLSLRKIHFRIVAADYSMMNVVAYVHLENVENNRNQVRQIRLLGVATVATFCAYRMEELD